MSVWVQKYAKIFCVKKVIFRVLVLLIVKIVVMCDEIIQAIAKLYNKPAKSFPKNIPLTKSTS